MESYAEIFFVTGDKKMKIQPGLIEKSSVQDLHSLIH